MRKKVNTNYIMSVIAIGGGELTSSIYNKILSLVSTRVEICIGLITDAGTSVITIKKIIREFKKQSKLYSFIRFTIYTFNLIDFIENKKTDRFKNTNILFVTGGSQQKIRDNISTLEKNNIYITKYFESFLRRGGVLVGTSAGASILGCFMPQVLDKGLGILNTIIDQHFIKHNRINDALKFVKKNPDSRLIGIDENTMIIHKYNKNHNKNHNKKKYYSVYGSSFVIVITNSEKKMHVRFLENGQSFYMI